MGKHINSEWIKRFVDGEDVECEGVAEVWRSVTRLDDFNCYTKFRIKPEPVYPESSLTDNELSQIWNDAFSNPSAWRCIANAAVKRHCQDQEKEGK